MLRIGISLAPLLLFLAVGNASTRGSAQEAADQTPASAKSEEQKIHETLSQPFDLEFVDTPLLDVADFLAEKLRVDIVLDRRGLEDEGLDATNMRVDLRVKNVSARAGLRLFLEQLDLTYVVADDALSITTQTAAEGNLQTRVYPVMDLAGDDSTGYDYDGLVDLITTVVRPETWGEVGGPGNIQEVEGMLTLSQTQEIHDSIRSLLAALRTGIHTQSQENRPLVIHSGEWSPEGENQREQAIRDALSQPARIRAGEIALADFAEMISRRHGFPVVIDRRAFEDDGLDPTTMSVRADSRGASLRSTLNRATRSLDLTWSIRNEVLFITTPTAAEGRLLVKVYSVDDLVRNNEMPRAGLRVAGPFVMQPPVPAWTAPSAQAAPKSAPADVSSQYYHGPIGGMATARMDNGHVDRPDFDALIDTITTTIDSESWDDVGGPGAVQEFDNGSLLVVAQTEEIHAKIGALLSDLRNQRPKKPEAVKKIDHSKSEPDNPKRSLVIYQIQADKDDTELELVQVIQRFIAPESWKGENPAAIDAIHGALLIEQTEAVHNQISELLTKLSYTSVIGTDYMHGMSGGQMSGQGGFMNTR